MEQRKPEFNLLLLLLLVISAIGAINWGLIGIWNFDLVLYLFGTKPVIIRSIYIAIGIAGTILMLLLRKILSYKFTNS